MLGERAGGGHDGQPQKQGVDLGLHGECGRAARARDAGGVDETGDYWTGTQVRPSTPVPLMAWAPLIEPATVYAASYAGPPATPE